MSDSPTFKEGDWVLIKSIGEIGVIVTVYGEEVRVRVPRNDDWPYPDYIQAAKSDLRRTRRKLVQSEQPDPIESIEPALF